MSQPIVPSITDEQLAEIEEYVNSNHTSSCVVTKDEVSKIITRLRAAEKDAARYRWLRDRVGVDFAYGDFMAYLPTGNHQRDEQDKKQTDDAIDAALEQQP